MLGLAVLAAVKLDRRLLDPEGSFLGPSYIRLPLLLLGALLLDLLPMTLWDSGGRPARFVPLVRHRLRTHWTRERTTLVAVGVISFYLTYVSYRNLKSFLPFVRSDPSAAPGEVKALSYDRELHIVDRVLFFGADPSDVLHTVLGTSLTAHVLSPIYLAFLPLVPLGVTAWLVWSRNISYGYWFVTSQCLAWSLGTLSYYLLPTLGPGIAYWPEYTALAHTGTTDLMNSIVNARGKVLYGDAPGSVNSIAGFASLHCAITLLFALIVQYTLRSRVVKWVFWVNFGLTVIATLYFGWHYVADDIAGVAIAVVSFYIGGLVSGQRFDHGLHARPPEAAKVPADLPGQHG
ncbi:phosphatase PAP2 family protein [Nocardioides sp. zg-536]|uniref:Phosphatase PAP2 family protein n=2 Tax=Nocardioides faecalis TaxID=2803858 RepID=A0A938Y367_9ACTN|nr:phosphatase PAP2 family protein [Nocardioides faecalis]MBS4752068.1 phosphatase PAP2 family protein [Nocardioides faecalis]QVI60413.1 phosphatase PAP2 family protein [Nocardioides faecalis]